MGGAKQNMNDDNKNMTLQIKEEQLDLAKKWVQTGDVKIYRESFSEEKSFTVPIVREELVIEKSNHYNPPEIIRIPLSQEQVVFTKNSVTLEDVSIYKQQIEEIIQIEETLKREKAKLKISGFPRIREKSN